MSNFQDPNLIVKNGVFLFVRLLFVLFLAFFTTRLTLQILGDENYGIYNIVGGIVAIFNIISLPIRDSLQRFFNVEFAKGELDSGKILGTSVKIVCYVLVVLTLLYESLGLYIVNYIIDYPRDKTIVVNTIFQISALSNIFAFASVPYMSLLLSKENMGIPAFCEVFAAILRIVLLVIIPYIPIDVLIPYSCIFLFVNLGLFLYYRHYCKKKYYTTFERYGVNDGLKKKMFSFSGWSFIEAASGITITYVSNVFINIFGGILFNTAYGVSKQLQQALSSFAINVLKASDPQITSGTAVHNDNYRNQLVMTTAKISFLGVGFVYIVFHFDGEYLLSLWLKDVPKYTFEFCDIMLLSTIFTSLSSPFRTLIMATGKIKKYFLSYGIVSVLAMAIMYILLKQGFAVVSVLYMILLSSCVIFIVSVVSSIKFSSLSLQMVLRNLVPSLATLLLIDMSYKYLNNRTGDSLGDAFFKIAVVAMIFIPMVYLIACNKSERKMINCLLTRISRLK